MAMVVCSGYFYLSFTSTNFRNRLSVLLALFKQNRAVAPLAMCENIIYQKSNNSAVVVHITRVLADESRPKVILVRMIHALSV